MLLELQVLQERQARQEQQEQLERQERRVMGISLVRGILQRITIHLT